MGKPLKRKLDPRRLDPNTKQTLLSCLTGFSAVTWAGLYTPADLAFGWIMVNALGAGAYISTAFHFYAKWQTKKDNQRALRQLFESIRTPPSHSHHSSGRAVDLTESPAAFHMAAMQMMTATDDPEVGPDASRVSFVHDDAEDEMRKFDEEIRGRKRE